MIKVAKSDIHGYGIFAERDINIGEIILESIFIDVTNISRGILLDHVFGITGARLVLALDRASIINHSNNPNSKWELINDKIVFSAIKKIKKGDEILHNYGYCNFKINN